MTAAQADGSEDSSKSSSTITAAPGKAPQPAISVRGMSKAYRVYDKPASVLGEVLLGRKAHREKTILQDINLEILPGEVVGVIGRNGAGKSTLLKLIAGTLAPSSGKVDVRGRVSAILELGTGFNPAYSGRDNVIMSAIMRGMPEHAIKAKFDSIVAFAGLADVIDQPFHTYSSGMQARLAFAAAVAVDADVIIIDEALAAGDIRFTARSLRRVREICESGVTALFVSHQTYHVMQLCSRAIWIDEGRIKMDGSPIEVCRAYEYQMHAEIARDEGRGGKIDSLSLSATQKASVDVFQEPLNEKSSSNEGTKSVVAASATIDTSSQPSSSATSGLSEGASEGIPSNDVMQRPAPGYFGTHEYRITKIAFLNDASEETTRFRFGEPFRLQVEYECLLEELPNVSCGVAAAFTSADDLQHIMYFNTNYPHTDAEMLKYDEADFRKYKGRVGVVEAKIPFLQVKAGEYLVSVGILSNTPELHQFYEFHYLAYKIIVLTNGFPEPSVFYPFVEWRHTGPNKV